MANTLATWTAPEILSGGFYTEKADIYALGLGLFSFLLQKILF